MFASNTPPPRQISATQPVGMKTLAAPRRDDREMAQHASRAEQEKGAQPGQRERTATSAGGDRKSVV